jgi:N-acyl-D-aspartate/D-glutamate deacylase
MGDEQRVILRGGAVVDGTGAPARRADVLVVGDRIAEVGDAIDAIGAAVIDASGAVVAPGFIDTHTHFDPSLYWDPAADPMPQHGVTTVLTGNCALSLVPVRSDTIDDVAAMFSFIEDMPRVAFDEAIPWNWETFGEYRDGLDATGLGVNVAALIGHSALRLYAMGPDAWERAATTEELDRMTAAFDAAMADGAFGISISKMDVDARGRPVPSRLADATEIEALVAVLGRRRAGLVELLPNFMHDGGTGHLEEMGTLLGRHGVPGLWNGLVHSQSDPERSQRQVELAARQHAAGIDFWPMMSPRTLDFRIGWDRSVVFLSMPNSWNRIPNAADDAERRRLLADPAWRETARAEWEAAQMQLFPTRDIARARLVDVAHESLAEWRGRSLADLVAARGGHPSDVLAGWVLENDVDPGVVVVGVGNTDADGVGALLASPDTLISASDAGAHVQMMCAAGDTTLLLTRHVRDRGDLTLEAAVHELTAKQARVCGIRDRGRIEAGLAADLTVFALDELTWGEDTFVDDLPSGASRLRRPPGGYRATLVNGVVTQRDGVLTGDLPARVLRSN